MSRLKDGLKEIGASLYQGEQLIEAQGEVDKLQGRIRELEAKISSGGINAAVSAVDSQFEGVHLSIVEVPITSIRPFLGQPRKTFSQTSIARMAQALQADGQQEPLRLIADPDSSDFLIWDGERRWRGAQQIGWVTIQARVVEMPADLHYSILKGFFTREDLNGLDRAEAVIETVSRQTNLDGNLCLKSIRSGYRKLERNQGLGQFSEALQAEARQVVYSTCGLSGEQADCIETIAKLGINLGSFVTGDIMLLSLPDALKEPIRRGLSVGVAKKLKKLWTTPPAVEDLECVRNEAIQLGFSMTLTAAGEHVAGFYSPASASKTSRLKDMITKLDISAISGDERLELLKQARTLVELLEAKS